MVSKWLDVKVAIDVNAAKTALNWLSKSAEELSKHFQTMKGTLSWVSSSVNTSASHFNTLWNTSSTAWNKMKTAFSGVSWVLRTVWSSVLNVWRQVMWFMSIVWGIWLVWSIDNLKSFSKEFSLLQATAYLKDPKSIKMMKDSLFDLSNTTWDKVENITKSMTQLFSTWVWPTAAEWTKAYNDQLKETIKIQEIISKTAIGTGSDSEAMWNAWLVYIKAFKWNVNDIMDWRNAMSMMSATLDTWRWTMEEYVNQFWKFWEFAERASFSQAAAMSTFAKLTLTQTVDVAGNYTKALTRFFTQGIKQAFNFENQIKRIKEGSAKAFWVTDEEYKRLKSMTGADFWEIMYDKKSWKARWELESLKMIEEKTKWMGKSAKNAFITALSGWRSEVSQALWTLLWDKDYVKILTKLDAIEKKMADLKKKRDLWEISGDQFSDEMDLRQEKYNIVMWWFGAKRDKFMQSARNSITKIWDALSPALWVFLDMASWALSWKWYDKNWMAAAFAEARANIEWMNPALWPVIDKLESMANRLISDDATKFFNNAIEWATSLAKWLGDVYSIFTDIWSILWPIIDIVAPILKILWIWMSWLTSTIKSRVWFIKDIVSWEWYNTASANMNKIDKETERSTNEKLNNFFWIDTDKNKSIWNAPVDYLKWKNNIPWGINLWASETLKTNSLLSDLNKKPQAITNVYMDWNLVSSTVSVPWTNNVSVNTTSAWSAWNWFNVPKLGFSSMFNK